MRWIVWFFLRLLAWVLGKSRSIDDRKNVRRVLIGTNTAIGDAVMALPLVDALVARFERVDVWASPLTAGLFRMRGVRCIWTLPSRPTQLLKLLFDVRNQRYDVFIGTLTSNTLRQCVIPFLSSIRFRYKHETPHRGFVNYDFLFTKCLTLDRSLHRVYCNLQLLSFVGVSCGRVDPQIQVSSEEEAEAVAVLQAAGVDAHRPLVACHPGCNPSAAWKRWPQDRYVTLLRQLVEQTRVQVVVLGGPDEVEIAETIESLCGKGVFSVAAKTSLLATAAILKRCQCIVTNDSGIMHVAAAVGTPVFAIFGPTSEGHIGPLGKHAQVLRNGSRVENVEVPQVLTPVSQFLFNRLREANTENPA